MKPGLKPSDFMMINARLLKKHELGLCTPEEVKAIEGWLNATDDESTSLADTQIKKSKRRVWLSIQEKYPLLQEPKPLHSLKNWSVAIACSTVVLFSIVLDQVSKRSPRLVHKNNAERIETVHQEGLSFHLQQNSGFTFDTKQKQVSFIGDVEIINNSDKIISLKLEDLNSDVELFSSVKLYPNKTYYVFSMNTDVKRTFALRKREIAHHHHKLIQYTQTHFNI